MNLDSSKDYIAGFVIIIVSLYAARTAPPLPNVVIEFIDTLPGRLLFITLIAFMVSYDIRVALIISVAFTLTLMYVQNEKVKESFVNQYIENFDNHSGSEEECTGEECSDEDEGSIDKYIEKAKKDAKDKISQQEERREAKQEEREERREAKKEEREERREAKQEDREERREAKQEDREERREAKQEDENDNVEESFTNFQRVNPYTSNHTHLCPF